MAPAAARIDHTTVTTVTTRKETAYETTTVKGRCEAAAFFDFARIPAHIGSGRCKQVVHQ